MEKVGISIKDAFTTILSKIVAIIFCFSEFIPKLVLFSRVLIIFHGARNFPTFSGFLHGKLRARDCKIISMLIPGLAYSDQDTVREKRQFRDYCGKSFWLCAPCDSTRDSTPTVEYDYNQRKCDAR